MKRVTSITLTLAIGATAASAQVADLGVETTFSFTEETSTKLSYFTEGTGPFGDSLYGSDTLEEVLSFFGSNPTSATESTVFRDEYAYYPIYMRPSVSGNYTFGQLSSPVDTLLYFYEGEFDPENFATNFIGGNDDYERGFGQTAVPDAVTLGICGDDTIFCPVTTLELSTDVQFYTMLLSHYRERDFDGFTAPMEVFAYGPGEMQFFSLATDLEDALASTSDAPTLAPTLSQMSVLERVLLATSPQALSDLTGVYVNVAENIGGLVDGSVTQRFSAESQQVSSATMADAQQLVSGLRVDLGIVGSTALGAVNTGNSTLGLSQSSTQAGGSSSSALSAGIVQVGGANGSAALVLNDAANSGIINGSLTHSIVGLSGSTGAQGTTALGGVNTGNIASGVNAIVQGIVGMPSL